MIDRLVLSVNILVSWYKNSGTDPLGNNACTIDEGGSEVMELVVDNEEDGLLVFRFEPRFAKANDG